MQTVKVRLRKPSRVFTVRSKDDVPLTRGMHCVVRSERGLEFGTCVLPPEDAVEETTQRLPMQVIREASEHDFRTYAWLAQEEAHARRICSEQIAELGLAMRLVDVEYTFDKRKVTFYFTAEERVDFRELVRDLAHQLRTRIELRHIQVRDQAKMIGGLGECGRRLCCGTWLREFIPISMKMAKRQSLSLNPEKISGQCGRLMCCLSFEDHLYEDVRRSKKRPAQQQQQAPDAPPRPEAAAPRADQRAGEGTPAAVRAEGPASQAQCAASAPAKSQPKRRRRHRRRKPAGEGAPGRPRGGPPQRDP